jgi:hypothetical protein
MFMYFVYILGEYYGIILKSVLQLLLLFIISFLILTLDLVCSYFRVPRHAAVDRFFFLRIFYFFDVGIDYYRLSSYTAFAVSQSFGKLCLYFHLFQEMY